MHPITDRMFHRIRLIYYPPQSHLPRKHLHHRTTPPAAQGTRQYPGEWGIISFGAYDARTYIVEVPMDCRAQSNRVHTAAIIYISDLTCDHIFYQTGKSMKQRKYMYPS